MTLAMQEEIVDAEIVPSKVEVLQQIERAIQFNTQGNAGHASFWDVAIWIADNHAWLALDFDSLGDLWEARFSHLEVVVPRSVRGRVVESFRRAGLTQQEIADKLGVNQASVSRDLNMQTHNDEPPTITNSRGQSRPTTYKKREQPEPDEPLNVDKTTGEIKAATEVAPTAHQSPFAAGETIKDFGNGTVITAGYSGLAESTAESVTAALNWYRANPTSGTEECEAATGVSERVAERSRAALIGNKEIPDPKPNRLVERFDKIAHGLTYIADDLEKHLEDLDRAEPEDLEYGREFFEDAMTKLNHFRRKLNTKFA